MAELVDRVISRIATAVAEDLVEECGRRVSPTAIALHVAELFEDLSEVGSGKVIDLAEAYVKAADVNVHIPVWRLDEDGRVKSEDELKQGLGEPF